MSTINAKQSGVCPEVQMCSILFISAFMSTLLLRGMWTKCRTSRLYELCESWINDDHDALYNIVALSRVAKENHDRHNLG